MLQEIKGSCFHLTVQKNKREKNVFPVLEQERFMSREEIECEHVHKGSDDVDEDDGDMEAEG